jgi:hypothetical protein
VTADLWDRYAPTLRRTAIACAAAFTCITGGTIVAGYASYRYPAGQLVLWAVCATAYLTVAGRTRGPTGVPVGLVALLLAADAASAIDPPVGTTATAWVPTMLGAALSLAVFTGPVGRNLALVAVSICANGLLVAVGYGAGMPTVAKAAAAVYGNVGLVGGAAPALVVVVALGRDAQREARQRRRTEAAQAARECERAVHADRQAVLEPVLVRARDLLAGLASGTADPADPTVRQACQAVERQLRLALQAAVAESGLAMLAERLLASAPNGVELTVQGDPAWDALPGATRRAVAELLRHVLEAPAVHRLNLTILPEAGRVWISLTGDGGRAPDDLPAGLPDLSRRGSRGGQWWLEWTMPAAGPDRRRRGDDDVERRSAG